MVAVMTNHQVPRDLYDHYFAEVNDYLGGTMRIDGPPIKSDEEYLESLTDEEYDDLIGERLVDNDDWPIHVDFYGHVPDSELPLFEDGRAA